MKYFILLFALLSFSVSQANGQAKAATHKSTAKTATNQKLAIKKGFDITFANEHLDIGTVKRGETRKFNFEFTNTGTETIQISNVSSCDCTTVDWPRKAIKSGEKVILGITFDSTTKEESETVSVDLYFKNMDPKTKAERFKYVDYKFILKK